MSSKLFSKGLYVVGGCILIALLYSDYQTLTASGETSLRRYDQAPVYTDNSYHEPTANLFVANRVWQAPGSAQQEQETAENEAESLPSFDPEAWSLRAITYQGSRYIAWIERPGQTPLHQAYSKGDTLPDGMEIKAITSSAITITDADSGEDKHTRLFPIE